MLDILFFARIREQLDVNRLQVPLFNSHNNAAIHTVSELIESLVTEHGQHWHDVLNAPNVIVAVNHQVCNRDHCLANGDELAFFPPVTGG